MYITFLSFEWSRMLSLSVGEQLAGLAGVTLAGKIRYPTLQSGAPFCTGAMSISRSSRAAQGLFRRLAVTPGAALRNTAPASWTQASRAQSRLPFPSPALLPRQNTLHPLTMSGVFCGQKQNMTGVERDKAPNPLAHERGEGCTVASY